MKPKAALPWSFVISLDFVLDDGKCWGGNKELSCLVSLCGESDVTSDLEVVLISGVSYIPYSLIFKHPGNVRACYLVWLRWEAY